ncbi:uncharacterized protein N7458_008786 [Penicillium daleae]|uniref:HAT C-terminal dimerisation domain-containing protein n=1 Tax=Penicillium daleae TaxID=63821 RepID=A0AAD6FXF5_9EURO|nr:uncharacterized protein N7458_008786 [Penicillium daleae]KAJ5437788.1 hypothetical protein N7458_008786 [Penicillium daleae]
MTDADLLFENSQTSLPPQQNELIRYLNSPTVRGSPRIFWKDHEYEFPILVSLARDIMLILVTRAGVERLFNSARDICYYRRGDTEEETKDLVYEAEGIQSPLRPRTGTLDLDDREALDHEEDDDDDINPLCLTHSSVYLVESISARSYLRAMFLDLNNYTG